jgi:hypothetical protein
VKNGSLPASPEDFFLKVPLYEKSYFYGAEVYNVTERGGNYAFGGRHSEANTHNLI